MTIIQITPMNALFENEFTTISSRLIHVNTKQRNVTTISSRLSENYS